ncbi:MAG: Crp/Fnr family transcriptional regulator [Acidobacteriota bacterium]
MVDEGELRAALASLAGLARVDLGSLRGAAAAAQRITLASGAVLFEPGDACRAFGIVLSGRVRVVALSAAGRELVLYRVQPGEACTVTVSCLLGGTPYPARGVVEGAFEAVAVPLAAFRHLVDSSPDFRSWVFALMSVRLVDLMRLVSEVAFGKLDQRLAALLLDRGPRLALSHQELASEVGSTREIVSRVLESLQDQGLVRLARRQVEVVDSAGLSQLRRGAY